MSYKIPLSEIVQKLSAIRSDLFLDESTYIDTKHKAKFVFVDGTEWWTKISGILRGATGPVKKLNEKELIEKIKSVHGDKVKIDFSTFMNVNSPARFIDIDFGEWWAQPSNVYSLGNSHPKRGIIKRKETCLEKFGSPNPTGNKEIKLKRDKNNIEKYGFAHIMQVPEIAMKAAKKSNESSIRIHWKTREELICQASYEPKVIDYLNKNKIEFKWQSETFTMPNGNTYRPDFYLINENKWVEIKGFMRKDAQEKWDWFKTQFPNAELWNEAKLKEMGIL